MRKIYFYLPLIFFLTLVAFFARQLILNEDPSQLPSVLLNKELPIINLKNLSNYKLFTKDNLTSIGEPVLVNVWSSWCAPCQIEHEFLMEMSNVHNIKIFGINYKDDKKDALRVLKLNVQCE